MNWLQKKILGKELIAILESKASTGEFRSRGSFFIANGTLVSSEDNKRSYLTNGLLINDIIYSITKAICDKIRECQWAVYKIEDESSLKRYRAIVSKKDWAAGDYQLARDLRNKALKPYEAGKLNDLLKFPNEECSFPDMVADSSLFKMVTGGRLLYGTKLDGGANKGKIQYIDHLPYQLVTILASNTFPMKALAYEILEYGLIGNKKFEADDVLHDKFFNPDFSTTGSHLYGLAPLKAALRLTDRSNSANKAATASFQNGGPKQLVSLDDDRLSDAIAQQTALALKKSIQSNEYTGPDSLNKAAVVGYKANAVPLGLSPVDLDIIESEKWDLRRFCNVFGAAPSQIFNDPDNKVYNNTKEGEKAFVSRCVLPYLNTFRDAFNRMLPKWGLAEENSNVCIEPDLTCYSELQEDQKEKWSWVKELPVTWKYKLELMGLDFEDGQEGLEEIMIPSGFQPIDSLNVVDDVLSEGTQANGVPKVPKNGKRENGVSH